MVGVRRRLISEGEDHAEREVLCDLPADTAMRQDSVTVPARLGQGQGAKEIGHNLAHKRPKFGHNLVRKRTKIGHISERERPSRMPKI